MSKSGVRKCLICGFVVGWSILFMARHWQLATPWAVHVGTFLRKSRKTTVPTFGYGGQHGG
jgi:hypothetical protein